MPKTGSTSIQWTLKRFQNKTIKYASFRDVVHTIPLAAIYSENFEIKYKSFFSSPHKLKEYENEVQRKFTADLRGTKDLILSSEGISSILKKSEIVALRSDLVEHFDEIRCLIYFRPARSFMASVFQQSVKQGKRTFDFADILYRKRFEHWIDVFGRDTIAFRLFQPDFLRNGDVVDDACEFFNLDPSKIPKNRVNETLSVEALSIVLLNNFAHKSYINSKENRYYRRRMVHALRDFGREKFGFSDAVLDKYIEHNKADIDWAESLTGFDLCGKAPKVDTPISSLQDMITIGMANLDLSRGHLISLPKLKVVRKSLPSAMTGLSLAGFLQALKRRGIPR